MPIQDLKPFLAGTNKESRFSEAVHQVQPLIQQKPAMQFQIVTPKPSPKQHSKGMDYRTGARYLQAYKQEAQAGNRTSEAFTSKRIVIQKEPCKQTRRSIYSRHIYFKATCHSEGTLQANTQKHLLQAHLLQSNLSFRRNLACNDADASTSEPLTSEAFTPGAFTSKRLVIQKEPCKQTRRNRYIRTTYFRIPRSSPNHTTNTHPEALIPNPTRRNRTRPSTHHHNQDHPCNAQQQKNHYQSPGYICTTT